MRKTRFWLVIPVLVLAVLAGLYLSKEAANVLPDAAQAQEGMAESAAVAALQDKALQNGFVPHKALYEIDLIGTSGGSQVVNISGQMFFKWDTACDAWITDHRFKLVYEYADSPAMRITSDFSTFETFDGTSFDFTSTRKRDGQVYEELRGRAVKGSGERGGDQGGDQKGGEAVYTMPDGLSYDLAPGTLFPMAHTLAMLKAVRSGERFYAAPIFDGSDADGPVLINAFIGGKANAMARITPTGDIDASLLDTDAHKLRMAFFPLSKSEAAADYEMNAIFHENGIISDMVIEYDDFTISQKLVALEKLEPEPCRADEAESRTDQPSGDDQKKEQTVLSE
jgi:hypothetical protein